MGLYRGTRRNKVKSMGKIHGGTKSINRNIIMYNSNINQDKSTFATNIGWGSSFLIMSLSCRARLYSTSTTYIVTSPEPTPIGRVVNEFERITPKGDFHIPRTLKTVYPYRLRI